MKNRKNTELNKGEIVIYKAKRGDIELKVKFENETIWLDAHQMAQVFNVKRPAVVKHINNIYKSGELDEHSTCSKMEQVAADGKIRRMNIYNLDIIISVGYRVNSQRATEFRIWATKILKNYLLEGYAVNERRLLEANEKFRKLQNAVEFLQKKSNSELLKGQEKELLNLLVDYSKTLSLLEQYDKGALKEIKGEKSKFVLAYNYCLDVIAEIKEELISKKEAGDIFGVEINYKFESLVKNLY